MSGWALLREMRTRQGVSMAGSLFLDHEERRPWIRSVREPGRRMRT